MNWVSYHKQLLQLSENAEPLTPSQTSAKTAIISAIQGAAGHINLWGNPGVGKTFLAHYLHYRADVLYFSSHACYDRKASSDSTVAIDNGPYTLQESRLIYDNIRWSVTTNNYSAVANVILITREPILDVIARIELTLTDADIAHMETIVQQQFGDVDIPPVSPDARQNSGLWLYVKNLTQKSE